MHFNTLLLRLSAAALTASTLAVSALAAPGTVTAQGGLRLRAKADTTSAVVKTLSKGTVVDVTATIDDEWYQVTVDNHTGYVSREYIRMDEATLSTDRTGTVTAQGGLRLRSNSAKDAPVLTTLSKGTIVNVLEIKADGWYHISVDPYIGYVSGEYIQLDEASQAPQPEPPPSDAPQTETQPEQSGKRLGVVTAVTLNIRSGPDTSQQKVGTLSLGTQVTIQGEENGWYKIEKGYISAQYISFDLDSVQAPKRTGVVSTTLNVRSGPSTVHTKVAVLSVGEEVTILGEVDGWYKLDNGYVSAEYVTLSDGSASSSGSLQSRIVAYAKKFLGYPYVLGGRGPNSFDCSGLMQYIYKNFGYTLNRTATTQLQDGVSVKKADLQLGDLVFFNSAGTGASRATHVGVYIGGGQFLHASSPKVGVVISDLNSAYYKRVYTTARRII